MWLTCVLPRLSPTTVLHFRLWEFTLVSERGHFFLAQWHCLLSPLLWSPSLMLYWVLEYNFWMLNCHELHPQLGKRKTFISSCLNWVALLVGWTEGASCFGFQCLSCYRWIGTEYLCLTIFTVNFDKIPRRLSITSNSLPSLSHLESLLWLWRIQQGFEGGFSLNLHN